MTITTTALPPSVPLKQYPKGDVPQRPPRINCAHWTPSSAKRAALATHDLSGHEEASIREAFPSKLSCSYISVSTKWYGIFFLRHPSGSMERRGWRWMEIDGITDRPAKVKTHQQTTTAEKTRIDHLHTEGEEKRVYGPCAEDREALREGGTGGDQKSWEQNPTPAFPREKPSEPGWIWQREDSMANETTGWLQLQAAIR
ncbi:uncharacterized protein LOC122239645 isoform X2 [Panthera tigris]|uniref:uncharacterized protein LOC122239645 isoform X2 n=1 Tax=Panthera tigris TaxID=9694 RepID=UPI001C6F73B6|nr:uncharacterized protein LOC122239645 isoform X2 [Panthera tigris]